MKMNIPAKITWKWIVKLLIFSMLTLLILLDVGVSWLYVNALINPGCLQAPPMPAGLPAPQNVQLEAEDITVPAYYYPSQNGAAVITLGGLGGAGGDNHPPAAFLIRAGYGVLQIGSRACAAPPAQVTVGYHEVQDAAAGLAFLQTRAEVDPNRIGLFGFSMGGVSAIRTAARHPEAAAVLAEGGYYNLGADIVGADAETGLLRRAFLYTIAGVFRLQTGINPWDSSPVDDIATISPRPVYLIYGEHEVVKGRPDLQYEAAQEPKTLWIVPGGDHGTNYGIAQEEYERRTLEFFEQALAP